MLLNKLEFGSFLTYSPKGSWDEAKNSRTMAYSLKNNEHVEINSKYITMSECLSDMIKIGLDGLPFNKYFKIKPVLVPVPKSSFYKPDTIWVPQHLSYGLLKAGLAQDVKLLLQRKTPVAKSSTSLPENRPKAIEHYHSIEVKESLDDIKEILLVDDVITRGATLLGAASKIAEIYPHVTIRGFAFIRTMRQNFKNILDPCVGKITLQQDGNTMRRP